MKADLSKINDLVAFLLEIHKPFVGVFRAIYEVSEPSLSLIVPDKYLATFKEALSSGESYDLFIEQLKKDK